MTKKILALALAGTTAFSVFGGVLSVNALYSDAYATYTPKAFATGAAAGTDGSGTGAVSFDGIAIDNAAAPGASSTYSTMTAVDTYLMNFDKLYNGLDKIAFTVGGTFADSDEEVRNGLIYMYDYAFTLSSYKPAAAGGLYDKIAAFQTAYRNAIAFKDADNDGNLDTTDQTNVTALLTALNTAENALLAEFHTAYGANCTAENDTDLANVSSARAGVLSKFKTTVSDSADLVSTDFDSVDWREYNVAALRTDIDAAKGLTAQTSTMVYLKQQYDLLFGTNGKMSASDPSMVIDNYERLYEKLSERTESDYTAANYRTFTAKLAYAQSLAETATTLKQWNEAYTALVDASNVSVQKGSYKTLETYLKSLFTNKTIVADYDGATAQTNAVYKVSDYSDYYGTTAAWRAAFVDTAYVNSAYTEAYNVYVNATRYGSNIPSSDIERVYNNLIEAIDALTASDSSSEWKLLELQAMVDEFAAFADDDFYTGRTSYKEFATAYANAERVLSKTNPGKQEVSSTITNLQNTFGTGSNLVMSCAKSIPYSLRKELTATIREAQDTLKGLDNETGAQYKALDKAIYEAQKVSSGSIASNLSSTGTRSAVVSDVNNAIADLETAIKGFVQPQGWYKDSAGKWMYGEGDSYYTNGWKKVGASWYYFNADGTAKQNEWFKDTDGEWYWFTNNANAAYGWAKVNGEWYYFKGGCKMVTGWYKVNGGWYYMAPSGKMMTGWVKVNNKWYYLSKESNAYGKMLENTTTPDGYKVGADGAMIG